MTFSIITVPVILTMTYNNYSDDHDDNKDNENERCYYDKNNSINIILFLGTRNYTQVSAIHGHEWLFAIRLYSLIRIGFDSRFNIQPGILSIRF